MTQNEPRRSPTIELPVDGRTLRIYATYIELLETDGSGWPTINGHSVTAGAAHRLLRREPPRAQAAPDGVLADPHAELAGDQLGHQRPRPQNTGVNASGSSPAIRSAAKGPP